MRQFRISGNVCHKAAAGTGDLLIDASLKNGA